MLSLVYLHLKDEDEIAIPSWVTERLEDFYYRIIYRNMRIYSLLKLILKGLSDLLVKQARNADLKNNIAWIYVTATDPAVRDVKKALRFAREAILEAPDAPNIWNTLAAAHYAAGDYGQALRASQIAVTLARKQGENKDTMDLWEMLRRCERAAKNPAPGAGAAAARP